jgi:hypothetical protein
MPGRVSGPSGAAAKLGIARSTLESKIRSLKINKNRLKPYSGTWGPVSHKLLLHMATLYPYRDRLMREPFQMPFHNFRLKDHSQEDIAKSEPFEYHNWEWIGTTLIAQVVLGSRSSF